MSPRVGAYVCPRGVSGIEYRIARAGIEVIRSFDVPGRIESEHQAMEQLLVALADAKIRRADLVITLRGFGTVHHVLGMPPARDELLHPLVAREIRRLEPGLDAPTTSWLPLPSDPTEASDGPTLRPVLAAGAPRHVVETMEDAIRSAGHRLTHLTVLPAAMQRLHEQFLGGAEPAALVAPLPDGAFLGFFIAGAIRLVVEPPIAPDEQHDALALAEETELGAMFLRQQFRGAQLSQVIFASPPATLPDAESVFTEKLGIPVSRIATSDLSSGGLVALGGVVDSRSSAPLGLGVTQSKGGPSRRGPLAAASYVTLAIASALAVFALYNAYEAREASDRVRLARARVEQESFGLAPLRQTTDQRRRIRDAVALLRLVEDDRRAFQQSLAALAGTALPPVRFDEIKLDQTTSGWIADITGTVNGESTARSVELLNEFYRDLPRRLAIEDLVLEQLQYDDVRTESGSPSAGVKFRVTFLVPYKEG